MESEASDRILTISPSSPKLTLTRRVRNVGSSESKVSLCPTLASLITLGILCSFIGSTWGHVGLTFPPARKYDLDFLDKIRTKPPCGMPKGSLKTSLMAGSKFNVTWHLSYPHRGGYRLELMDSQERQLLDLTPKTASEEYIKGDPTAQWHMVDLPKDFTCDDCTIRLLREASEWSGNYRFWSCADVDIVEPKKYKENCMGHGRPLGGRCICSKGFSGSRCQYEDECETEKECNGNGRCINLGGTALPRKQCFCNPGFHGEKCSKRNAVKLPSHSQALDLTRHTKRILSDRMVLYYKTIPAAKEENKEIEFILIINGTSYGAIGWRPSSFDRTCKRWPYIQNATTSGTGTGTGSLDRQGKSARLEVAASEPKAEAEPKAEPESEPSADSPAEPEPASHDGKAEPEAEAEPKSLAEPEAEPKSDVEPKAEAEPNSDAEPKKLEAEPKSDAEPEAEAEPKSDAEPEAEAEPKSDAEPEPESEGSGHGNKTHKAHEGHDHHHDESAEPEVAATTTEGRQASKPLAQKDPQRVEVSTSSSTSSSSSDAGKLKAKLKAQPKLPEGTEVHVETSSIYVSRPKRSPVPEDAKAEPEPESEPETVSAEPEPESASAEPESNAEPESEPKSEPESEPKGEPESEAEAEPSGNGHHHEHTGVKEYKPHDWAPKGDFHAMDCIDLIMGGANGVHSRIRDYYTRDRSTPRLDPFWGGKEDITSATGWEKDGQTTLIFRRKVRSTDEPDHDLEGELHLIWARGQEPGEYYHKPKSGLETGSPTVPQFYAPDEIKYHGHGGQRGITRIDFLKHQQAEGEMKKKKIECGDYWSWPQTCVSIDDPENPCDYIATWVYKPESDSVQFTIETKKSNKWTGIGFSDSPGMRNTDAVLGWVTSSGQYFLMDTYMTSYAAPILDRSQDISEMTGKYVDGNVKLTFTRPVKSKVDSEKDVSLDQCRFFLFPVEGGTFDAVSKKIRKHEFAPMSSTEKICIPTTCRPASKPKAPTHLKYTFDIKLTGGLGNNWQPPPKNSEDFAQLGNRLRRDLETRLKSIPGYSSIQLSEVKKEGEGVVAKLDLMVSPQSELADMSKVEQVLKDTIASGQAGALQVDPKYLQLIRQEPIVQEAEEDNIQAASYFGGQRFWIVLGCVAALILLALVQAGLTIYKTTGKSSSHKGSPSSGSGMAWRDYSETNYGYDAYDEKQLHPNSMPLQTNPNHANGHVHQQPHPSRSSHHENGHYDTNHGNGHHHTSSKSGNGYAGQDGGQGHGHHGHGHGHGHMVASGNGSAPPSYLSLQRQPPQHHSQQHQPHHRGGSAGGGGGGGGLGNHNSDFYFMPSQRKYSGEVVRVYVDHNKR